MWCVYVLRSQRSGHLYVGITKNLPRRLEHHNTGQAPATRGCGPFDLAYVEEHKSRSEAMRRERALKGGQGRAWLAERIARRLTENDSRDVE